MPKRRRPTLAAGATIQRTLLRRFLNRRLKLWMPNPETDMASAYADVLEWVDAQPIRAKRKGGIGRR